MSCIAPRLSPCSTTKSSDSWLRTSTSALPIPTTWRRLKGMSPDGAGDAPDRARDSLHGALRMGRVFGAGPQATADGGRPPVQRRALLERPREGFDDRTEVVVVELLTVLGACRARDVLVHQRAPEIVAPGLQRLPCAVHPALRPRHLDVVDPAAVSDPADGVYEQHLAHRGTATRLLLQVDGARQWHERQANELGEPTRFLLQLARAHKVTRDVDGLLDVAEHDRDVRP